MPGTDRRSSTSSEDASLTPKQILQDGTEFIPTRTAKTGAPKPAANPLQFIKVGPCDLYKAAQEQLKKVEEIKKVEKTVKDESEDWQSNLDNWKCSRRKRQEHIIDRVVEVKKLELEEHERNRRRGKTLNEMMEERTQKGVGPRKMSLLVYPDDDATDLTDLGISVADKNNENGEDNDDDDQSAIIENNTVESNGNGATNGNKNGVNGHETSSPEPEEYTYERAIQGYKSFAEKNVKAASKPRISPPKRETGGRIGEKLNELEQVRLRSNSVTDVQLPKVDIHKRRSLFEVVESAETKSPSAERVARDLGGAKIVKERLTSLERKPEVCAKPAPKITEEVSLTLKDRLSNLEKQKPPQAPRISNDELSHLTIKDRLTSLEKGIKESSISMSDEEIAHKELLSPAVSEREVSSPLVSCESVDLVMENINTNIGQLVIDDRAEVEVNTNIEVVIKENVVPKIDEEEIINEIKTDENKASEIIASENDYLLTTVEDAAGNGDLLTTVEDTIIISDCNGPILVAQTTRETCGNVDSSPKKKSTPLKLSLNRKVVQKPALRKRKLTPILTAPITVLSPVKSPGDLQIITEDVAVVNRSNDLTEIDEEDVDEVTKPPIAAPRQSGKGAETSESGIDMEESSLYTDENIDEVLGVDDDEDEYSKRVDEDNVPDSAKDLELSRRQMIQERGREDSGYGDFDKTFSKQHDDAIKFDEGLVKDSSDVIGLETNELKQQEAVTRFDELIGFNDVLPNQNEIMENIKNKEIVAELRLDGDITKPMEIETLVDLSDSFVEKQSPPIALYENIIIANQMVDMSNSGEILSFPLSPMSSIEPPKEKPPPPPIDLSDEETEAPELPPKTSLRRLDSTKRIKKEIRKKRSDFLGIEGANDDAYLEPEVDVEPPPDMMTLLQEERRHDQQLYRQSLCSEADSSEIVQIQIHTSAVDRLDKSIFLDQGLYRQSICSESDSNHETAESRDSGVELDRGHVDDLCWNKQGSEPHSRQNSEPYGNPSITSEEDEISKKEREIIEVLEKEEEWRYGKNLAAHENREIGETLADKLRQLEQEKLQLEWERAEEEGRRMADEERLLAKETLLRQQETSPNNNQHQTAVSQENLRGERERLEKEQIELARVRQELLVRQRPAEHPRQNPMTSNLRYSMPDLQDARPPPPNSRTPNTWSRVPSADNLLSPQQMSRTTLQALSAAPRSRIVNGETWIQPKRKADAPKGNYNYQHWLIQEAEHRRITEQQQRATQSRRSLPNQQRPTSQFSPNQHPHPPQQQRPHSGHYPNHVSSAPYVPTQPIIAPTQNGVHYASQSLPSSPRIAPPLVQNTPPHAHTHVHSPMSPPSHHTIGLPPTPPVTHPHSHQQNKPLPDSVIQTLTQRVQNKTSPRRRVEERPSQPTKVSNPEVSHMSGDQERMLSVSGKKKCSHCGEELGRGAAMVIESLRLFYHIDCFKCCVCHTQLGDGLMGTDVRVRNNKLHCHNCYSSDDGVKFSCV